MLTTLHLFVNSKVLRQKKLIVFLVIFIVCISVNMVLQRTFTQTTIKGRQPRSFTNMRTFFLSSGTNTPKPRQVSTYALLCIHLRVSAVDLRNLRNEEEGSSSTEEGKR